MRIKLLKTVNGKTTTDVIDNVTYVVVSRSEKDDRAVGFAVEHGDEKFLLLNYAGNANFEQDAAALGINNTIITKKIKI